MPDYITAHYADGSELVFVPKVEQAPAPEPAPAPRFLGIQPPTLNDASGGGAAEVINLVWTSRGFRPPVQALRL